MLDLILQFAVDVVRALLVDELSGRVRNRLARYRGGRTAEGSGSVVLRAHRRNRDRLLHRLRTEIEADQ